MVGRIRVPEQSRASAAAGLEQSAELLRTLAHLQRLRMLQLLLTGRYTVGKLADACGLPSHMASEHLRLMQRCRLLARRKEGRKVFYRISLPRLAAHIMACIDAHCDKRAV